MCRVSKRCVFKLLQNHEKSLQNYPENPGNCVSAIPDFKIFPEEHALGLPLDSSRLRREIVPPPVSMHTLASPLPPDDPSAQAYASFFSSSVQLPNCPVVGQGKYDMIKGGLWLKPVKDNCS